MSKRWVAQIRRPANRLPLERTQTALPRNHAGTGFIIYLLNYATICVAAAGVPVVVLEWPGHRLQN